MLPVQLKSLWMRLNRDQKATLVVLLVGSVAGWILWGLLAAGLFIILFLFTQCFRFMLTGHSCRSLPSGTTDPDCRRRCRIRMSTGIPSPALLFASNQLMMIWST